MNEDLFFDSSGEMWFVFAKLQPFLTEVRQKANIPQGFTRIEKLATRTKDGRERLQMFAKRAETMRAKVASRLIQRFDSRYEIYSRIYSSRVSRKLSRSPSKIMCPSRRIRKPIGTVARECGGSGFILFSLRSK